MTTNSIDLRPDVLQELEYQLDEKKEMISTQQYGVVKGLFTKEEAAKNIEKIEDSYRKVVTEILSEREGYKVY